MKRSSMSWLLAGVVVGYAGLATSYLTARIMNRRVWPLTSVAEFMRDAFPARVVNWAKDFLGAADKPALVIGIVVILTVLFALIGRLGRRATWAPLVGYTAVGGFGLLAALKVPDGHALPVVVGFLTWLIGWLLMGARVAKLDAVPDAERFTERYSSTRRELLAVVAAVASVAGVSTLLGKFAGRGREAVEQERSLKLRGATKPVVPGGAALDVEGIEPWMTPVEDFYVIDTAFSKPSITQQDWTLRIHGMVERELTISYADLVERGLEESWVTLNCVSNEIGGNLIGNAWWTGVPLAALIAEAGPADGADAILQTSEDGWTCGTPLAEVLDPERGAMLAVGMNGTFLTIEHGYPVRTLVPGLYGYVSACKWVVDMEITRFSDFSAFWTDQGWSEQGPVKIASRIDVPASGSSVTPGPVMFGGSAWHQFVGIEKVEIAVDGGRWTEAEIGTVPSDDTWVQWRAELDVAEGEHEVKVRATGRDGAVQTGAIADVLPDGATGWHTITITAG